jgi:hypothetical protein
VKVQCERLLCIDEGFTPEPPKVPSLKISAARADEDKTISARLAFWLLENDPTIGQFSLRAPNVGFTHAH